MRPLSVLVLPLIAACATATGESAPEAALPATAPVAAELVEARKAMMHMAATLLYQGAIPAAKPGGDVKSAGRAADGLVRFGRSMAGLFPDGSGAPDSRALPAVWQNKADFVARATAFGDSAARLKILSDSGDFAGFAAQAQIVEQSCDSCHAVYRAERRKPS